MLPNRAILPRCLYSGTPEHPIYVDRIEPDAPAGLPVIMLHGGCHTGSCYLATPDGRQGWAELFAAAGHPVLVPDWPGHGRSPAGPAFAELSGHHVVDAVAQLIVETGPVILIAHSAAGPVSWILAERLPGLVRAIIGVAPGAPANILRVLPDDSNQIAALRYDEAAGCPVYSDPATPVMVPPTFMLDYWCSSDRFPKGAFEAYRRSVVAESPRIMNERFNIGGTGLAVADRALVASRPILIVTGDMDPRHSRAVDGATARYLDAEFVWLPDRGIAGNGHMMMIDNNNDAIAALLIAWIADQHLTDGRPE